MTSTFSPLVVVPVFDHPQAIAGLVDTLRRQGTPCLLVDDGSGPECAALLAELAERFSRDVSLLRLDHNQGKGAAVIAGMREAGRRGHSHALQIDADGQHDAADVPRFLAMARQAPAAVINGRPVYDASVPKARLYGRYATHIWVWINTLSFTIRDSMCGFRVYPLAPTIALLDAANVGKRMDFDTEILVRLYWQGLDIHDCPTRVTYPAQGVSHFRMLGDNLRISAMHTRLFFGMLLRLPRLLARKVRRR